jgi:hypothetical protein
VEEQSKIWITTEQEKAGGNSRDPIREGRPLLEQLVEHIQLCVKIKFFINKFFKVSFLN